MSARLVPASKKETEHLTDFGCDADLHTGVKCRAPREAWWRWSDGTGRPLALCEHCRGAFRLVTPTEKRAAREDAAARQCSLFERKP